MRHLELIDDLYQYQLQYCAHKNNDYLNMRIL